MAALRYGVCVVLAALRYGVRVVLAIGRCWRHLVRTVGFGDDRRHVDGLDVHGLLVVEGVDLGFGLFGFYVAFGLRVLGFPGGLTLESSVLDGVQRGQEATRRIGLGCIIAGRFRIL